MHHSGKKERASIEGLTEKIFEKWLFTEVGWIQVANKKHRKATKSRKPWSPTGPKTQRERSMFSKPAESWSLRREMPHRELLPRRIAPVFNKSPEEMVVNEYTTLFLQPFLLLFLLALPVDWMNTGENLERRQGRERLCWGQRRRRRGNGEQPTLSYLPWEPPFVSDAATSPTAVPWNSARWKS